MGVGGGGKGGIRKWWAKTPPHRHRRFSSHFWKILVGHCSQYGSEDPHAQQIYQQLTEGTAGYASLSEIFHWDLHRQNCSMLLQDAARISPRNIRADFGQIKVVARTWGNGERLVTRTFPAIRICIVPKERLDKFVGRGMFAIRVHLACSKQKKISTRGSCALLLF